MEVERREVRDRGEVGQIERLVEVRLDVLDDAVHARRVFATRRALVQSGTRSDTAHPRVRPSMNW